MRKGWETKKMKEICELINGRAYKQQELLNKGKYRVLRVGNFFTNKDWYYSDLELPKDKYCDKGDLLYAWSASFGPRIWNEEKVIYHYHIWKVIPNEEYVTKEFLFKLLEWDVEKIKKDHGTGTTMIHVGKGSMEERELPVPPLEEQKRIVEILDEAFAAIDKAKANVEKNLQNAKELFEGYLHNVFNYESKDYEKVTLSELASDITDGDHLPPPKASSGIPFITISNINKKTNRIDFSDTFKVPKEYFQRIKNNRKPRKGDVLYTVTGSFGIPVIIDFDKEFCFQRHIGLIRPKKEISCKWLYYWILSPQSFKQASESATGTAQKTVSLKSLRSFLLPKISLKEQELTVKTLDTLHAETEKLKSIYEQKLNDLEELKKSIFRKSFTGELTQKKVFEEI